MWTSTTRSPVRYLLSHEYDETYEDADDNCQGQACHVNLPHWLADLDPADFGTAVVVTCFIGFAQHLIAHMVLYSTEANRSAAGEEQRSTPTVSLLLLLERIERLASGYVLAGILFDVKREKEVFFVVFAKPLTPTSQVSEW